MNDDEVTRDEAVGARWWGDFALAPDSWGHWRVGPLGLWVGRTRHEWQIVSTRDEDPFRDEAFVEVPVDLQRTPAPDDASQHRVAYTSEVPLRIRPVLADRPVVTRPASTFSIPPGERVSVFVSTAVWVRLSCGTAEHRLFEDATWRSTDTWFGDNHSGFLCYATRTSMRLELDELPIRPHRALTRVVIDNRGEDTLDVERISLPVPNLSLFVAPGGALWTERLELTRTEDTELAHVHIAHGELPVPGSERLSGPRVATGDTLLSRVFTGLFG